jgi:hypothetical protein
MEDVKSDFNVNTGIRLNLREGSEVTMKYAEASYNGLVSTANGLEVAFPPFPPDSPPAKVILKDTNSFIGNKGDGAKFSHAEVFVSRGATLNAYNNNKFGVWLDSFVGSTVPVSLTVERGGAVNACGNAWNDLYGLGPGRFVNVYFPTSGKGYTCDSVDDANGFECKNECPICVSDLN